MENVIRTYLATVEKWTDEAQSGLPVAAQLHGTHSPAGPAHSACRYHTRDLAPRGVEWPCTHSPYRTCAVDGQSHALIIEEKCFQRILNLPSFHFCTFF